MLLENRSNFASTNMDEVALNDDPPTIGIPTPSPQDLDDVFFSANQDHTLDASDIGGRDSLPGNDVSDVARLRSTHNTAGYREGVSASKEAHVQEGFDEGYALGAEIGTRVGWILGALEGLVAGTRRGSITIQQSATQQSNQTDVRTLLAQARLDLTEKSIYSPEYFYEHGLWKYDVPDSGDGPDDGDANVTFRDVASAHPLILKWSRAVDTAASGLGARLDSLQDLES
jgi:hypothetical protein